jgi:hypothetical protein
MWLCVWHACELVRYVHMVRFAHVVLMLLVNGESLEHVGVLLLLLLLLLLCRLVFLPVATVATVTAPSA